MMRMQIMPGMRFWFHVSVFGFLTVPIFMYAFLFYMLEIKKNGFLTGYCIATVVAMGINVVTEVFIPEPDIIRYADESIGYAYHLSWGSYLFAAAEAGVISIRQFWRTGQSAINLKNERNYFHCCLEQLQF